MDYKEKYEQAFERAKNYHEGHTLDVNLQAAMEYVFPELKESEDEKIRKEIIAIFKGETPYTSAEDAKRYITWLEKQGEQKPNADYPWIKCSDGLPNKNGTYLVVTDGRYNDVYDIAIYDSTEGWHKASEIIYWMPIPQLNNKSIIEQKPTNKVEPKFKVGDWVVNDKMNATVRIKDITYHYNTYTPYGVGFIDFDNENDWHLWTIQDAKDGDILTWDDSKCIALFKEIYNKHSFKSHGCIDACTEAFDNWTFHDIENAHPATKEQRILLFSKMGEAGYTWDADKKELKKIDQEQTELPNGEDYGTDSLYHAARILEKTLGEVDGYQSDDGILEHKCAIEVVNRLYKQNSATSQSHRKPSKKRSC